MVKNGLLHRLQGQLRRHARTNPSSGTRQLATLVAQAIGARTRGDWRQDPATRTFQALRIFVNRELSEVTRALARRRAALTPGGRLAVISFHSLEDRIVKQFLARASQPYAGDPALARLAIRADALPGAPLELVGRAVQPADAEIARNPRARSAVLRIAERTGHALPAGLAPRLCGGRGVTRVNIVLLAILVACALSLVTSRNQSRRLFVELEQRTGAGRAPGNGIRPAATRAVDVGHAGASREDRARTAADAVAVGRAHRRGRAAAGRRRRRHESPCAASLRQRTPHAHPRRDALTLPRFRSPLVFGALALLFAILLGRSLYLQSFDNEFLQGQGSARHSRELEVPAHRGRIVDRTGEALALSTPVKSLWAFPDKFDATPEQIASLAAILETTPQRLSARLDANEDFAFLAKQVPPEIAERAMALRIPGLHDQNEYRRFYPGGEVTAQIVGFTGDHDAGQEGIELAQQAWLAGIPGSRRVIINRRNEAVEDVAAIRAPQAGHDLALSIDARLQYLAFRELKAAIELNRAKAGGLVILDVKSGEILALANWPTYNPNSRNKVQPAMMRNRALTDTFEPGRR